MAVAALLACEVVFIKDSYGERLYRMNTVFKLYFQAWTMLAIAGAVGASTASWRPGDGRGAPGGGGSDRRARRRSGLLPARRHARPRGASALASDGNAYLEREHPDDFAAVTWLRAQRCRPAR